MRILIMVAGTPNSMLSHRLRSLGRELLKQGHAVCMMSPSLDRHSGWQLDNPSEVDGIKMIYPRQLRTKSESLNLLPYLVSAAIKVLRQPADLIYLCKPTPATLPAIAAKWLKGTPIVLDMDDLGAEVMRLEGRSAFTWRLIAVCEWLLAREAAAIVVVSRYLEQKFTTRFSARKPVLRLPNGVDTTLFNSAASHPERKARLIFLGILGRRVEILGPVLAALPEVVRQLGTEAVQLEVLGDGPARAELEATVQNLDLVKNVRFHGWINLSEVGRYVAAGDIAICVMPDQATVAAASNQKLFQYQAMGLPTVVSDVGDLPDYVEHGAAGVVVPADDATALAKALVDLLQDREQRARMGSRARYLAETSYSWAVLGHRLEQFLMTVQSGR